MDIALGSWQYFDWMHSPAISSTADAINLLNHVQIIKVNGQNDSSLNEGGDTYFLIDRLGWVPAGALPAYDPSVDSLRKYAEARNLPVGSVIYTDGLSDPQYMRIFLEEFGLDQFTASIGRRASLRAIISMRPFRSRRMSSWKILPEGWVPQLYVTRSRTSRAGCQRKVTRTRKPSWIIILAPK